MKSRVAELAWMSSARQRRGSKAKLTFAAKPARVHRSKYVFPFRSRLLTALEVDAGGTVASIPLDAIRQTLRVADCEIARSAEKDSIVYDGKVIPFLALTRALGKKTLGDWKLRSWSVVVLEASSEVAAVGVDRLLGATTIVVRPLPLLAAAEAVVAGASVDAEGNPQLVLDPEELVATACLGRASVRGGGPCETSSGTCHR